MCAQQQLSARQRWEGLLCLGNGVQETTSLCALFCSFEEMHERGDVCVCVS